MEMGGFEPPTCALRTHRSGQLSYIPIAERIIPRPFQMFNRKSALLRVFVVNHQGTKSRVRIFWQDEQDGRDPWNPPSWNSYRRRLRLHPDAVEAGPCRRDACATVISSNLLSFPFVSLWSNLPDGIIPMIGRRDLKTPPG
jgi:hypothetical protein